ncbi:hypothetical protein [Phycicoccus sonneratiae]|uniref:Copper type II ascorbate-dependent monooxygenase C-terminal domain-containing protein n=1 Tax=Phycicoccus sonneratiae TaxID=2807628 RepID=A0ABS2CKJ6_9MICO|nr:hypothetical protein [Phycicoccus sonneraticus]MBM6400407.1 hypothetical protein [Phycicoccus sonneraticus]
MRRRLLGCAVVLATALGGCASSADLPASLQDKSSHDAAHDAAAATPSATPTKADVPLRAGERFVEVRLPSAYTPKAPTPKGTDDYRCFLVDPGLTTDQLVSGVDIRPDNAALVHHVIVSRVAPKDVGEAERLDAAEPGDGWTCFGGSGIQGVGVDLDDADWVGAWAPGGGERVMAKDIGIPLEAGSRLVVQMHYNLLAGSGTDRSTVRLRLSEAEGSPKKALDTMLLPAPVELPCRDNRTAGTCSRAVSVADVSRRFDERPATADMLHWLCGPVVPGPVQSCSRTVREPGTIRAVAGHMHLLGRAITVDVDKGSTTAQRVLDVANYDFDDQGSIPLEKPVRVAAGDTITVTCRHDQSLRDRLPAFAGQRERYVVWGEGTTDEMCLGIVLLTRP